MAGDFEQVMVVNSEDEDDLTLVDVLDHVLNTGVVIRGNLVISVAGVDLVFVGLDLILTSVETALRHIGAGASPQLRRR